MKYKLLNIWTAQRTLPVSLAARLVAIFRLTGRPHAYWVNPGDMLTVTVAFEMSTLS